MNQLSINSNNCIIYIRTNPLEHYQNFAEYLDLNQIYPFHQQTDLPIKKVYRKKFSIEETMQLSILWQLRFQITEIARILNKTPHGIHTHLGRHNALYQRKTSIAQLFMKASELGDKRQFWIITNNNADSGAHTLRKKFKKSIQSLQSIQDINLRKIAVQAKSKVVGLFFQKLRNPSKEIGCITHYFEAHSDIAIPIDGAIVEELKNMREQHIKMTRYIYIATFGGYGMNLKIIGKTKHTVEIIPALNKQGIYEIHQVDTKIPIDKKHKQSTYLRIVLISSTNSIRRNITYSLAERMQISILWQLQFECTEIGSILNKSKNYIGKYISNQNVLYRKNTRIIHLFIKPTQLDGGRNSWIMTKTHDDYGAHSLIKTFKESIESIKDLNVSKRAVQVHSKVVGLFFQKLTQEGKTAEQGNEIGCITTHSKIAILKNGPILDELKSMGQHIKMIRYVAKFTPKKEDSQNNFEIVDETDDIVEIKPAFNGLESPYQIDQTNTKILSSKDPKQSTYLPIFLVSSASEVGLIQEKQHADRCSLEPSKHIGPFVSPQDVSPQDVSPQESPSQIMHAQGIQESRFWRPW